MANLPETPVYTPGIYQIETTDPVMGGPDGISNLQAKQLANRTAWLKQIADEVIAARGGKTTLGERVTEIENNVEGLDPDMQNMVVSAIMQALNLAGLANREIRKTLFQRFQTGETVIYNRGVISGCTVTKSTNATRNLNLAGGSIFMRGIILPVPDMPNSAMVPANNTQSESYCYSYLQIDSSGNIQHNCTALGENVPPDGLPLYRITIPAGNNESNDPYLTNCTLTDVRRLEPGYPRVFTSAPFAYVSIPYVLTDSNYTVDIDILDFEGSGFQLGYVYVSDRQSNGFKINLNGTVDTVRVSWTVKKLNL